MPLGLGIVGLILLAAGCQGGDGPASRDGTTPQDAVPGIPKTTRPAPRPCLTVQAAEFSPDGKLLLVAYANDPACQRSPPNEIVRVFEVDTAKEVQRFSTFDWAKFRFLPSSNLVLAISSEGVVNIWNVDTGLLVRKVGQLKTKYPSLLAVSPDGRHALIDLTLWDLNNNQLVRTFEGWDGPTHGVSFTPDSKRIFAFSRNPGPPVAWDVDAEKEVPFFANQAESRYPLAFSPDGAWAVSDEREGADYFPILWDWRKPQVEGWRKSKDVRRFEKRKDLSPGSPGARSATFTLDGKSLLTGDYDGILRIWDLNSGKQTGAIILEDDMRSRSMQSIVFSADGKRAFSSSGQIPTAIGGHMHLRVWDVEGKKMLHELPVPDRW
jgi:WD40 repeat protein